MIEFEYPEGATPIDPDESDGLLLTHITMRDELNRWELDNINEAMAWADKTKPKDILNKKFVKELHRRMFVNVWKWAGRFRQSEKNIGGPWHQIQTNLRNLFDNVRLWIKLKTYPTDEIAVRFHHQLTLIHPFPNGNGRHARLMTDLLLENILNRPKFTWGSENLSGVGAARKRYIAALHAADNHDNKLLLEFVRT